MYKISQNQKSVIENALSCLSILGVFFIELCFLDDNQNDNQFILIQRISDNQFKIYDQVIPYMSNEGEIYPVKDFLFDGSIEGIFKNPGLKNKVSLKFYNQIRECLRRADILVYRNQKRNHSAWKFFRQSIEALNKGETLHEIFSSYLKNISDSVQKQMIFQIIDDISK